MLTAYRMGSPMEDISPSALIDIFCLLSSSLWTGQQDVRFTSAQRLNGCPDNEKSGCIDGGLEVEGRANSNAVWLQRCPRASGRGSRMRVLRLLGA